MASEACTAAATATAAAATAAAAAASSHTRVGKVELATKIAGKLCRNDPGITRFHSSTVKISLLSYPRPDSRHGRLAPNSDLDMLVMLMSHKCQREREKKLQKHDRCRYILTRDVECLVGHNKQKTLQSCTREKEMTLTCIVSKQVTNVFEIHVRYVQPT